MAFVRKFFITLLSIAFIHPSYSSGQLEFEILEPTVGPVLGKPLDNTARIWLRGPVLDEISPDTHYFGVLNIKKSSDENWSNENHYEFPLGVHYDVPGVKTKKDYVGFQDLALKPDSYDYRCGYYGCGIKDFSKARTYIWGDKSYTFTFRDPSKTESALAFGSCRYFAKLLCWYPWLNTSDHIFQHIVAQNQATDAFALIGDYIYGDYFNLFGQSRTYEQFMDLYEKAMSTPYFKQVIATIPGFYILDDHEVSNNFGEEYQRDHPDMFRAGMAAYMTYQHMVTPGFQLNNRELKHLGYPMKIGNVPAFMMNARSNRTVTPPRLIAEEEMNILKTWLMINRASDYKVIFSSVIMFPFYAHNTEQDQDDWAFAPAQLQELLGHINDNMIGGVIICAGDIHKSLYSQIETPKGIKITTVIATPFFSPWGHNTGVGSELQPEEGITEYIPGYNFLHTSRMYAQDTYARLEFGAAKKLRVQLFNTEGQWINENDPFSGNIDLPYQWD
jgi:hypothetical protein